MILLGIRHKSTASEVGAVTIRPFRASEAGALTIRPFRASEAGALTIRPFRASEAGALTIRPFRASEAGALTIRPFRAVEFNIFRNWWMNVEPAIFPLYIAPGVDLFDFCWTRNLLFRQNLRSATKQRDDVTMEVISLREELKSRAHEMEMLSQQLKRKREEAQRAEENARERKEELGEKERVRNWFVWINLISAIGV